MLIRNACIVDLAHGTVTEDGFCYIDGSTIASVGSGSMGRAGGHGRHGGAFRDNEEIIDADGAYLIPGLVNLHAHTAMAPLRGTAEDVTPEDWFNKHVWIFEKNLTPQDVYWGTLLGALEMLTAGVTCVADHYFHMDHAFRAFQRSGMRANIAQAVFGVGDDAAQKLDEAIAFTEEFSHADPRITVSMGPHSPYLCPPEFLRTVVTEAERIGVRMHIHVSETATQVQQSLQQHGKTPIAVLKDSGVLSGGTLLAHAYHSTDEDLALIRESGSVVAHCPTTYMRFGDMTDFLPRALRAGLTVGLGSDGAASNSTMSLFRTARDAALLAKLATRNPEEGPVGSILPLLTAGGRALGLPNYGEVRPGAPADLVLIRRNTAAMNPGYSATADILYAIQEHNVDTVLVDGRIVVKHGRHVSVDHKTVYDKNRELVTRIAQHTSDTPMQTFAG